MADCGEVDCYVKGEYFKQPYSLTRYYNAVDKIKVSPEVVEDIIIHMTNAMKWCKENYKDFDNDTFNHDYYEIVEYRKTFLNYYKAIYPIMYETFIEENPTVIEYDEYISRSN